MNQGELHDAYFRMHGQTVTHDLLSRTSRKETWFRTFCPAHGFANARHQNDDALSIHDGTSARERSISFPLWEMTSSRQNCFHIYLFYVMIFLSTNPTGSRSGTITYGIEQRTAHDNYDIKMSSSVYSLPGDTLIPIRSKREAKWRFASESLL